MAISRVNTTTQDSTGQVFVSVSIPTVTAGNTIVVLVADGEFNSGAAPSVSDNAGNTYTLQTSAFTGSTGNPARRNARIWTTFNAGGASSVSVFFPSACNCRIHVLEYSGTKTSSAVESVWVYNSFATGGTPGPITQGGAKWNVANSLLLSINADNSTNTESNNAVAAPSPPWTLISANRATYGGSLSEKIPTYSSPSTFESQGLNGNGTAQCWTSIVILKADLTITCTESIGTDDTVVNDPDILMSMEAMSLSDLVDLLLNGGQRFKSLVELINAVDTITFLSVYNRTLIELVRPVDTITFITQYLRALPMEQITIQDWLSVKKTNSTRWGN